MKLVTNMDAGETRHIQLKVHSTIGEPFVIRNPRYELLFGGTLEDAGECRIREEYVLDVLVTPQHGNCTYRLRYIYEIADEVYVDVVEITVRR